MCISSLPLNVHTTYCCPCSVNPNSFGDKTKAAITTIVNRAIVSPAYLFIIIVTQLPIITVTRARTEIAAVMPTT